MTEDFYEADTRSVPRADGVRDVVLTDRWDTSIGRVNGGFVMALMLRGLAEEMAAPEPLVASFSFLAGPRPGAAELRTSTLRIGRRVSTGQVLLVQDGRTMVEMTASFGRRIADGHPIENVQLDPAPDLPPVEDCLDPRKHGGPTGGLFDRVEYRLPPGPARITGERSGTMSGALWQRLWGGRAIESHHLALLTDSYMPIAMEVAGNGSLTVQMTVHLHGPPAPGWIATRVSTRHVRDGFHEEDCELYDSTGRLVAQSRQLALLV